MYISSRAYRLQRRLGHTATPSPHIDNKVQNSSRIGTILVKLAALVAYVAYTESFVTIFSLSLKS